MSPHLWIIAVAFTCAFAARVGSEVAGRTTIIVAVAEQLSALPIVARLTTLPFIWMMWSAACVAVVVVALRRVRTPRDHTSFEPTPCDHTSHHPARWLAVVALVFAGHGAAQWHRLATPHVGEYAGVAFARSDAINKRGAVTLIAEVDGENFRLTLRGRARSAVQMVRMGDALLIDAERVAYDTRRLRFVAGRHVQGELRNVTVHATAPSLALWHRAANRVHHLIENGSRTMPRDDAALVRGLLLGDESRQPTRMTDAFRAAELGHLLAVSGQNVVLLLAALTPLLRRLSPWSRLAAALAIVAMFALITRLESSVIRASVMAAIVQVGFAIGRDVVPLRALAFTVIGIVSLDPLATWSIGFVLSVAATTGLVVITPWLGDSIFAATTAAQLGVAPFVIWWFGSMPGLALLTNLLAVPVSSLVTMVGPLLLGIAAFVPDPVAAMCIAPVTAAVRFVWWVAEWGLRMSLPAWANLIAWLAIIVFVIRRIDGEVRFVGHPRARL
ncbi:MAG: ComEC/Rec2 family competence protein [Actinomycetota bacterium]